MTSGVWDLSPMVWVEPGVSYGVGWTRGLLWCGLDQGSPMVRAGPGVSYGVGWTRGLQHVDRAAFQQLAARGSQTV